LKKQDVWLLSAILLCVFAIWVGSRLGRQKPGTEVVVYEENQERLRFPLHEDAEYLIVTEAGKINRLVIENGQAEITEASCRDKLCVHQKAISKVGEVLVCLPNRLIVTVQEVSGNPQMKQF